jgi:O-methyltransferase involved in polyketide biosynthesis
MNNANKVQVDLHGASQTMLATLYVKALDAAAAHPILGDQYAKELVDQLDYDWRKNRIPKRWASATVRSAQYDIWARQFLAVHDNAAVLHVGCGLDSRVFRLDPGPGIEWYDVDYPDVIALRERLYAPRDHYRLIPASATDPSWLAAIPADRPVLLLAEGVTMYLREDEGIALLRRVVERFPYGELQLDFFNWLGIKPSSADRVVRRSGSKMHWAVNGPEDILSRVPGIRLLTAVSLFNAAMFNRMSRGFRLVRRPCLAIPPLRNLVQYHRYAF